MVELVEGGVIVQDTYVWKTGMATWQCATDVSELRASLQNSIAFAPPPPPPFVPEPRPNPSQVYSPPRPNPAPPQAAIYPTYANLPYIGPRSDRSRVLGGILQIVLPGVGRMYLGYYALGVMQLVLTICTGVMVLWPFIDGIVILSGGVKFDGFGRVMSD